METLTTAAPDVRHGQTLDYEALLAETQAAFEASGKTQSELARMLGKHRSSVHRALAEAGGTFASLQREIIAALTPYEVEEDVQVTFRVQRKAE